MGNGLFSRVSVAPSRNGSGTHVSKLVILSYFIDWIFIVFVGIIGRLMKTVEPKRHTFSLTDPNISYPFAEKERVTVTELVAHSLFMPGAVILVFSLLLVPGPAEKRALGPEAWRRKLWEWNAGWMGLGVAYVGAYSATEALKVFFGKPRPDLLSRCNPDLSDIAAHVVGGLGEKLQGAPLIVSWTICQNKSNRALEDGFVSFPSGHSSMAFAGMTYLTLWLCAKFAVTIPFFPRRSHPFSGGSYIPLRDRNAAPPLYLVAIVFVPLVAASFIASSRWVDNRHFGFDILMGSLLGVGFAFFGFQLYHLPYNSGEGWAWGPRDECRAFLWKIDHTSYADSDAPGQAQERHLLAESVRGDNGERVRGDSLSPERRV